MPSVGFHESPLVQEIPPPVSEPTPNSCQERTGTVAVGLGFGVAVAVRVAVAVAVGLGCVGVRVGVEDGVLV
jgi:hypothetical protein